MTEWTVARGGVIELSDGKPPYQWRHGWIPITPGAVDIKEKEKSGTAADVKPKKKPPAKKAPATKKPPAPKKKPAAAKPKTGVAAKKAPPKTKKVAVQEALDTPGFLPAALQKPPPAWKNKSEADWHQDIADYIDKYPMGYEKFQESLMADALAKTAADAAKKAKVRTHKASKLVPKEATPTQRAGLELIRKLRAGDTDVELAPDVTPEWETSINAPEWGTDEQDVLLMWQFEQDGDTGKGYYELLNSVLRGEDPGDMYEETAEDLDFMSNKMLEMLGKSRLSRDTVLFRGIQNGRGVKVGDTITDPAWSATSYNPQIAEGFRQDKPGSQLLVVHAKSGTNALRAHDPVEHEVMFGPNTPMKVLRIDGDEIHVEVGA